MDLGHYTPHEYKDCLHKLSRVGKFTGIYRDTFNVLHALQPKTILDVGCGDGKLLTAISEKLPNTFCHGIDISQEAISHAKASDRVRFSCSSSIEKADVIMATLVCHHMTDEEITTFIHEAYTHANHLVLINDLQRSRLAKWLFKCISRPLFSNRLISHDGIVSIERGFKKNELKALIPYPCTIRWRFPFRWQILIWKK